MATRKRLKDLEDRELVSEYTRAVRKTWEEHVGNKFRHHVTPAHNPLFQHENAVKRELLRRLS